MKRRTLFRVADGAVGVSVGVAFVHPTWYNLLILLAQIVLLHFRDTAEAVR